MSVQSDQLKERTMVFAVTALRVIDSFPQTTATRVVAHQLAKSATSVGANYRAACSARSKPEFVAKLRIVVEEAEESVYWLDVIDRSPGCHSMCADSAPKLPSCWRSSRARCAQLAPTFGAIDPLSNPPIPQSMTR